MIKASVVGEGCTIEIELDEKDIGEWGTVGTTTELFKDNQELLEVFCLMNGKTTGDSVLFNL